MTWFKNIGKVFFKKVNSETSIMNLKHGGLYINILTIANETGILLFAISVNWNNHSLVVFYWGFHAWILFSIFFYSIPKWVLIVEWAEITQCLVSCECFEKHNVDIAHCFLILKKLLFIFKNIIAILFEKKARLYSVNTRSSAS